MNSDCEQSFGNGNIRKRQLIWVLRMYSTYCDFLASGHILCRGLDEVSKIILEERVATHTLVLGKPWFLNGASVILLVAVALVLLDAFSGSK